MKRKHNAAIAHVSKSEFFFLRPPWHKSIHAALRQDILLSSQTLGALPYCPRLSLLTCVQGTSCGSWAQPMHFSAFCSSQLCLIQLFYLDDFSLRFHSGHLNIWADLVSQVPPNRQGHTELQRHSSGTESQNGLGWKGL